ncbi:SNARE domain protein [Talaromyces stipitatus ATCC 10500]|uniref:t-SNARE affecting a late Golgi compartment protein 1 n=1 Tax=Talaromyces stipitatus (strain ATCC 10500 / CBS 375.48 / QM 6759 / NRRL 1006) TaxID=441959 RepID=B8M9H0_TALSN|nr:SNARE domain protein [Talaromyces stipitatus ATCC 10500]EED17730.1 SNARE domain protein [Talaromyces stipitatus ATCC 10500]
MSEDPFLQVQSEVLNTLQTIRPLYSSFLRIRSLTTSPSNPELVQSRTELESTLEDLQADLADLRQSVRAVERDPYRYGLELDEVERRRGFVQDLGREVDDMVSEIGKQPAPTTAAKGKNNISLPNPSEFDTLSPDIHDKFDHHREEGEDDDYYANFEQQRQVDLMAAQDQQLDGVFRTVGNLRQQADTMGRELEDQAVLLDDVEGLADSVGGKLASGMKRIRTIVRKNEDTYSTCCIGILLVILVLLFILLLVL